MCLTARTVARPRKVFKVPPGVDDLQAMAGLPVAFGTAHLALLRGEVLPGQHVLVLGAGGGVGLAAVQIAALLGAKVVAVAAPDKHATLTALGATTVISSAAARGDAKALTTAVRRAAPRGVHCVVDMIGGAATGAALRTLAWGGRLVVVGFASGSIPKIASNVLLLRNVNVIGLWWGQYLKHDPAVLVDSLQQLIRWVGEGRLKVHVSHRFPLEEACEVFRALRDRTVVGKGVIVMDGEPGSGSGEAQPKLMSRL